MGTMGADALGAFQPAVQPAVHTDFASPSDPDLAFLEDYTHGQFMAINIISLCLGSISVASAVLAFYWFVRMRRNFRHE